MQSRHQYRLLLLAPTAVISRQQKLDQSIIATEECMQISATAYLKLFILLVLTAGCATKKYASLDPASLPLGQMNVSVGEGWLRAPEVETPEKRSISRTLSRETLDRDRLMLIPGVNHGQSIFDNNGGVTSLPVFDADMNMEQIANLVGQSMQQALWKGSSTVSVSEVRGHGYLGTPGFLFDIEVDMLSGPDHKGFAGGYVHEERLYVNIFVAESPAHFNEHKEAAMQVIESATVRLKTIRLN
jgi:hypothetical protein